MRVAICGHSDRASAWEGHLRQVRQVQEVLITPGIPARSEADTLILINSGDADLSPLEQAIRKGHHIFYITRIRYAPAELLRVHELAREAGVQVQLSHWPSLTQAASRIRSEVGKADQIQIYRELENPRTGAKSHIEPDVWTDEVALCVKWLGGNTHQCEVRAAKPGDKILGLSITIRFDSSALASIEMIAGSDRSEHRRTFFGRTTSCISDPASGTLRFLNPKESGGLSVREESFDPSGTAAWALRQFFKSVQMKSDPLFTPYSAYRAALVIDKIKQQIG